jgi:hypothetical protein
MIIYNKTHRKKAKTIEERLTILEKEFKEFRDSTPKYGVFVTPSNQPTYFPREIGIRY